MKDAAALPKRARWQALPSGKNRQNGMMSRSFRTEKRAVRATMRPVSARVSAKSPDLHFDAGIRVQGDEHIGAASMAVSGTERTREFAHGASERTSAAGASASRRHWRDAGPTDAETAFRLIAYAIARLGRDDVNERHVTGDACSLATDWLDPIMTLFLPASLAA